MLKNRPLGFSLEGERAHLRGASHPSRLGGLLRRRDVLPGLVVARAVSTMQRVEDAKPGCPRGIQDPQHVRHAVVFLRNTFQAIPELASFGDEIVVWIDHESAVS